MSERIKLVKPAPKVKLFLDSGVFSAWRANETLDIPRYVEFIKRNKELISVYATMDVIPGKFGVPRKLEEVQSSAKISYDNHQLMKSLGSAPIPIYHQGEHVEWLERYLKDGEPYIGISTAKDLTTPAQREWLDHVFTMLTDASGKPFVRTHGFGITTIPLMLRYPWFTCDSTTWSLAAGYGLIYVPQFHSKGKPKWDGIPTRIIMSGVQQEAWSSAVRQYEALGRVEKQLVDWWLDYCGVTPQQARYMSAKRRELCLKYFMGFDANYKLRPYEHRVGKHAIVKSFAKKQAPKTWERMSVIFATLLTNGQFSQIMNNAGASNRLISYYEYHDKDDDSSLRRYVMDGIHDVNYERRGVTPIWNDTHTSSRRMSLVKRNALYAQGEE